MNGIQTVGELIEHLEALDPDTPIALATQPGWPMEHAITTVQQTDSGTAYIVEGPQTGYLPGEARAAIGW